jgi:hypothetical protein
MSSAALQTIIGTALVDSQFCKDLLDTQSRLLSMAGFDLTAKERETILNAVAQTIQELSAELYERLTAY